MEEGRNVYRTVIRKNLINGLLERMRVRYIAGIGLAQDHVQS
jgi:hypothetical protein